jgi:hypothetical protein
MNDSIQGIQHGGTTMARVNRNKIERSGSTWYRLGGGHITWSPERADECHGSGYITARVGTREFWCEDREGYMYSFSGLVDGYSSAPAYMRTLARRVKRDIERDAKAEGGA